MTIRENIARQLVESAETKKEMVELCLSDIEKAAELMIGAVQKKKKILWCGNGGSAAQCQHLSTELVGGLRSHDRKAIPSVSLTTDSSLLTAWTNDSDFETVFSRQVEALGEAGDVLVALSTSGNSKNVIEAIKCADTRGIYTVVLTGKSGGLLSNGGSVTIRIPSDDTQRIQEGHITAGHILCELVENSIRGDEF